MLGMVVRNESQRPRARCGLVLSQMLLLQTENGIPEFSDDGGCPLRCRRFVVSGTTAISPTRPLLSQCRTSQLIFIDLFEPVDNQPKLQAGYFLRSLASLSPG